MVANYTEYKTTCFLMTLERLINFVSHLQIDNTLTPAAVQKACSRSPASSVLSTISFHSAIAEIYLSNAAIDLQFMLSARHHIDDEAFREGRDLITQGVAAVKAGIQRGSYISARVALGALCHTLQVQRDNILTISKLCKCVLYISKCRLYFKMSIHFGYVQ